MRASVFPFILFAATGTALPQIRIDDQCDNVRIGWINARCPTGYYCQSFNDRYSACVALTLSSILDPPSSTVRLGPITRTVISTPTPTLDPIITTRGEIMEPTPPVVEGRQAIRFRINDPCGGIGWTGDTTCSAGYYCQYYNDWFSGCMPLSHFSILNPSSTGGGPGSITRSGVDTASPTPTATRGQIVEAAPTLLAHRHIRIDDRCGGAGWTGASNCPAGCYCQFINQWYSQCLPLSPSPIFNPPAITGGFTRSIIETATASDIAATRAVSRSRDPTPTPLKGRQTRVEYTCGGMGYTGSTACPSGMYCHYYNTWYSQCLPGSRSSSSSVQNTASIPTEVASSTAAITTLIMTTTASS